MAPVTATAIPSCGVNKGEENNISTLTPDFRWVQKIVFVHKCILYVHFDPYFSGNCTEKILRSSRVLRDEIGVAVGEDQDIVNLVKRILTNSNMKDLFEMFITADVFDESFYETLEKDLDILNCAKQLKFFFNIPLVQVFNALSILYR